MMPHFLFKKSYFVSVARSQVLTDEKTYLHSATHKSVEPNLSFEVINRDSRLKPDLMEFSLLEFLPNFEKLITRN